MFFASGSIRQGSATCLCVATKKHALLYELNRTKTRHRKIKVGILFSCFFKRCTCFSFYSFSSLISYFMSFSFKNEGFSEIQFLQSEKTSNTTSSFLKVLSRAYYFEVFRKAMQISSRRKIQLIGFLDRKLRQVSLFFFGFHRETEITISWNTGLFS